jgi:hypothetical protein
VEANAQFILGLGRLEVVKTTTDLNYPAVAQPNLSIMQRRAELNRERYFPLQQTISDLVKLTGLLMITI